MSPAIAWSVGLLIGRDLVAVGEVVQVDPGAVGEAQRGPLPGLGQEVAPLAVYPPLPSHVDLTPDAALSGVSDPAYDLDTRQRIIVAPVLPRSLLNESLDAESLSLAYITCPAPVRRRS